MRPGQSNFSCLVHFAVLLSLMNLLSGCVRAVNRNAEASARTSVILGTVKHDEPVPYLVVVAALRKDNGKLVPFNYTYVAKNDRYLLRAEAGKSYHIVAFADRNNNLCLDKDEEVIAAEGDVETPTVSGPVYLDLKLGDRSGTLEQLRPQLHDLPSIRQQPLPVVLGDVTTLEDKRFSVENGTHGLWHPFDFVTETGVGVYFFEPYNPAKTPVLFVSGAGGSPQDWKYLMGQLDKSKYQPWVYVYPSGARLEKSSSTLAGLIEQAKLNYGLKSIYLVAHSMGGLVSRGALMKLMEDGEGGLVKGFLTISTPWHGHDAAKLGVDFSPAVVPSWIDMVPGSDYQNWLFSKRITDYTRYFMFFGFRGKIALIVENNDGAVSIASQLFPAAQDEASRVMGFNCDHTSILESPEVSAHFADTLKKLDSAK